MDTKFIDEVIPLCTKVADISVIKAASSKKLFVQHVMTRAGLEGLLGTNSATVFLTDLLAGITGQMSVGFYEVPANLRFTVERACAQEVAQEAQAVLSGDPQLGSTEQIVIANLVSKSKQKPRYERHETKWFLVLREGVREIWSPKAPDNCIILATLYASREDVIKARRILIGTREADALVTHKVTEALSTGILAEKMKDLLGSDFKFGDLEGDTLAEKLLDLNKRVAQKRSRVNPFSSMFGDGPDIFGDRREKSPKGFDFSEKLEEDIFGNHTNSHRDMCTSPRESEPVSAFAKAFAEALEHAEVHNSFEDPAMNDSFERGRQPFGI